MRSVTSSACWTPAGQKAFRSSIPPASVGPTVLTWARGLKNSRFLEDFEKEERGNAIVPDIAPQRGDLVIKKQKPGAFFGTPLLSYLIERKVDTLLVTGVSTSGCVRASVIEGFSYNYRVAVVQDGCYDRSQASHAINLCDMNAKYADVVSSDDAIAYVGRLPDGLFRR